MSWLFSCIFLMVSCCATAAVGYVGDHLLGETLSLAQAALLILGFQIFFYALCIFNFFIKLAEKMVSPQTEAPKVGDPAQPDNPFAAPPPS